jgi:hypothetical protein
MLEKNPSLADHDSCKMVIVKKNQIFKRRQALLYGGTLSFVYAGAAS